MICQYYITDSEIEGRTVPCGFHATQKLIPVSTSKWQDRKQVVPFIKRLSECSIQVKVTIKLLLSTHDTIFAPQNIIIQHLKVDLTNHTHVPLIF